LFICNVSANAIDSQQSIQDTRYEMEYFQFQIQSIGDHTASEMTYIVSSGALNSTHSLTCSEDSGKFFLLC